MDSQREFSPAARIGQYLEQVDGYNLGAQVAYGVVAAGGPYALSRPDLEAATEALDALHGAETRTEYGWLHPDGRHVWGQSVVRSGPCDVRIRRTVYIGPTEEISND